jgi:phosphoribosyl 1,2-cyclic phosphodiesterase
MRVTLYGTRGSIPAPGPETMRYGGNTPAVQVFAENGAVLVLDAGSGIRRLGAQLSATTTRVDILLTHLHMDHIQGLGFFPPLYNPAVEVHLWGPASSTLSLEARLSRYLSPRDRHIAMGRARSVGGQEFSGCCDGGPPCVHRHSPKCAVRLS